MKKQLSNIMSRHKNSEERNLHSSIINLCSSLQRVADATDVFATVLRSSAREISDDIDGGRLISETAGIHEGLSSTLRAWSMSMTMSMSIMNISKENTNTMTAYMAWSALNDACRQLTTDIDSRSMAVNTAKERLSLEIPNKTDDRMLAISGPVSVKHVGHVGYPYNPQQNTGTIPPQRVPPPVPFISKKI